MSFQQEQLHLAVLNLIDAAYNAGWYRGRIGTIDNPAQTTNLNWDTKYQAKLIKRRQDAKTDLISLIDQALGE